MKTTTEQGATTMLNDLTWVPLLKTVDAAGSSANLQKYHDAREELNVSVSELQVMASTFIGAAAVYMSAEAFENCVYQAVDAIREARKLEAAAKFEQELKQTLEDIKERV